MQLLSNSLYRNQALKFLLHNTNILFLKVKLSKDMTERVFRIPLMSVKNKRQISPQAKQGCSGNSKFSGSLCDKRLF